MRVYLNFTVNEKSYSKTEDGGPEAMCPNDGFVYFRNSELIAGQLGKGTLGQSFDNICFFSSSTFFKIEAQVIRCIIFSTFLKLNI